MIASPPAARTGAAIRSSSVATTTRDKDFAFDACRQTRTTIGTPSISASAFAGKREDPYRAGTTAITVMSARNFLRCKGFAIREAHRRLPNRGGGCQFRAAISAKIFPLLYQKKWAAMLWPPLLSPRLSNLFAANPCPAHLAQSRFGLMRIAPLFARQLALAPIALLGSYLH
jgi:hypothetical protein